MGIAINAETNRAYVANWGNGGGSSVSVIDTTTNGVITTIPASIAGSPVVAVDPALNQVYVINPGGSSRVGTDGYRWKYKCGGCNRFCG